MEIPEYSKHAAGDSEKDVSKMQVTSVSEEVNSRLGICSDDTESSPSTSKHCRENISTLPSQPMETTKEPTNFDPSKAPQKKAKLLRIERKRNKLLAQGKTLEEIDALMKKKKLKNAGKSLEDFFDEISSCSNKLEVLALNIFFLNVTNIKNKIL